MPKGWRSPTARALLKIGPKPSSRRAQIEAAGAHREESSVLGEFGEPEQTRLGFLNRGVGGLLGQLSHDLGLHAEAVAAVLASFDVSHGDEGVEHAMHAGLGAAADRHNLAEGRTVGVLAADDADQAQKG